MITSTVGAPPLLLVGVVRGLAAEVEPLLTEVRAFAPRAIGLGISEEELAGLDEHFVGRAFEPLVPLSGSELSEARGLSRFGEVRVPSPSALALLEWARSGPLPVQALDPSDDRYAEMFTDHISYFELVRRTLRERKLTKAAPAARTAEEFATRWHASLSGGRGSRSFDRARAHALAASAERLARTHGRVAVVVDRERYDTVLEALRSTGTRGAATAPA